MYRLVVYQPTHLIFSVTIPMLWLAVKQVMQCFALQMCRRLWTLVQLLIFQLLRAEFRFFISLTVSALHTKFRKLKFGIMMTSNQWLIWMMCRHFVQGRLILKGLFFAVRQKTAIFSSSTERLVTSIIMMQLQQLKCI